MKNTVKTLDFFLLNAILLLVISAVLIFILLFCFEYRFNENITTQYGDKFRVTCGIQNKWSIENDNDLNIRIKGFDKDVGIIGLCNTTELRCYLIGSEIIFCRDNSNRFEMFDEDLYSNKEMVPIIESILLKNNVILTTYLPYFFDNYSAKTETMLQDFIDKKYELLSIYGLTPDVISNESIIESMQETAKEYLLRQ